MAGRDRAVVQDHVRTRGSSQEKRPGSVSSVWLEESAEGQLETGVEKTLRHFVLGGDQQRHVGWFQGRLEKFDVTAILQLEIRLEGALTDGASGIDGRQEADLVVRFGCVPFSKTFDMNIFGITTTLARGDEGVVLRILLIKTHVTNRIIAMMFLYSG